MAGLRGRPRKNPQDRKDVALRVRFTREEMTWIQAQAKSADQRVAAWVRRQVLRDRKGDARASK